MKIDLDAYFQRINFIGKPACNQKTLQAIHRAQRLSIPFEMLDSYLGIVPSLKPNDIFKKLVLQNRGGGCSQLNELLALVLQELGFKVERLLSRVIASVPEGQIPHLSHKILRVSFDNEVWLCDVGFGGNCILDPMPWNNAEPIVQPNGTFQLFRDESTDEFKLSSLYNQQWHTLYTFNTTEYFPEDFLAISFFNARNPIMGFSESAIITLQTLEGRRSLKNRTYHQIQNEQSFSEVIKDKDRYHHILKRRFNILLPEHPDFFPENR